MWRRRRGRGLFELELLFDDLHDPGQGDRLLAIAERVGAFIAAAGGGVCVIIDKPDAIRVATAGRSVAAPRLDDQRWRLMIERIGAMAEIARRHGVHPVAHPHRLVEVGGDPDDGVEQVGQFPPARPDPLDEHELGRRGDVEGTRPAVRGPAGRRVRDVLTPPQRFQHPVGQQIGPVEERVVPGDVVGVHDDRGQPLGPGGRAQRVRRRGLAPGAATVHGHHGRFGEALNSAVSPGVVISGARVNGSVISPDVHVHSYTEIDDSVILDGVQIGRNCRIQRSIIDKNVTIPEATSIGFDREKDEARGFSVTESGITVVGKGQVVTA